MPGAEVPIYLTPGLADYLAALRHRAPKIARIALLLALLVALFSSLVGPGGATYQASADVLIEAPEREP